MNWGPINTSNKYVLQEADISVVFYDRSKDWRAKIVTFTNWTRLHHCGIILSIGGESILLMSGKSHRAKFIDADRFHKNFCKPSHTLKLGRAMVSVQQITDYIRPPYTGDARSLSVWYFFTNSILRCKSLQPKTCALLISNILRICGFYVTDCVTPKKLYRELQKLCS